MGKHRKNIGKSWEIPMFLVPARWVALERSERDGRLDGFDGDGRRPRSPSPRAKPSPSPRPVSPPPVRSPRGSNVAGTALWIGSMVVFMVYLWYIYGCIYGNTQCLRKDPPFYSWVNQLFRLGHGFYVANCKRLPEGRKYGDVIGGILMGSMLPWIAAPWILWVGNRKYVMFFVLSNGTK